MLELALNGVGGNTYEEVKRDMSTAEFSKWQMYYERFGSLNVGRRIEQHVGMLDLLIRSYFIKNVDPKESLPHESFQSWDDFNASRRIEEEQNEPVNSRDLMEIVPFLGANRRR